MGRKEAVLARLRQTGDGTVSGQELARELGITRTAVWKIVRGLQREGYRIAAVPNRGYRLEGDLDRLSAEMLQAALPELVVSVLQTVDSTNTEAKRRIVAGENRPMLIAAEAQTGGRGRQGKSFYSPEGTGIYMTLVVHPNVPVTDAVSVTTRASVAVCRAIRNLTAAKPEIKWVNDLYLADKKICGILVEAVSDFETGITKSLVIGVGVNIRTVEFPAELAAASLHPDGVSRNDLIAEIVRQLLRETADLRDRSYLEDYRRWSLVIGKPIHYWKNDDRREAVAIGIDDNGGLVIEENGQRTTLQSGEISVRLR